MQNIRMKLAAVVLALGTLATPALAGKGGSAAAINAAVASGSVDAIIAEVERAESLICTECVQTLTNLTEDSRYEVREVAAWWFARRPGLKDMLTEQFVGELPTGNAVQVRNAADFLGATRSYEAIPQLRAAMHRGDLTPEARLAVVRAAGLMAHVKANDVLTTAMADSDATVRATAVAAWRDVLNQQTAQPVVPLLADRDPVVRAKAAGVVGGMAEQSGRGALEVLVTSDPDPVVRRNAAWALGQLGNAASRAALLAATTDKSGLVRNVARASLASLK